MCGEEVMDELENAVLSWAYKTENNSIGVMEIQDVQNLTLIHPYCIHYPSGQAKKRHWREPATFLVTQSTRIISIGAWPDAIQAIHFYACLCFEPLPPLKKTRSPGKKRSALQRQLEVSVFLADEKWFDFGIGLAQGNVARGVSVVHQIFLGSIS